MEIIRKVFCGDSYEGLYRLIKNHKYEWFYVNGTTGDNVNIDELDYPILNVEEGRKSRYPIPNFGTYSLPWLFYFEPQDLEDGNCLGG